MFPAVKKSLHFYGATMLLKIQWKKCELAAHLLKRKEQKTTG